MGDYDEIIQDWADDYRKLKSAHVALSAQLRAFIDACQGEEEPRLWRISWAESLFDDLWDRREPAEDEDEDATLEAHTKTCDLFRLLRVALRAHAPEE